METPCYNAHFIKLSDGMNLVAFYGVNRGVLQ